MQNLSRLNGEEIENMKRPIISQEFESVEKQVKQNLPTNKSSGSDGFIGKFYQTFRRVTTQSSQAISKTCKGRNASKLILQGQHHLDSKSRQRYHKKEITGQHHWQAYIQKSSTKYQQTQFNNTLKGAYTVIKWDLFQGCKNGSIFTNNQCDTSTFSKGNH